MTTDYMGSLEKSASQIKHQNLFKITSTIPPAPLFHTEMHTPKCVTAFLSYSMVLCHLLILQQNYILKSIMYSYIF